MMRDGMEALEITEAKMTALGLPGFGPEFNVSCANHGGPGLVRHDPVGRICENVVFDQRLRTI